MMTMNLTMSHLHRRVRPKRVRRQRRKVGQVEKQKNWRLVKTNLEKEVDTEKCAFKVTNNSVYIYLAKVKGEFGYSGWIELCEKRPKKAENKDNPTAGLMDM